MYFTSYSWGDKNNGMGARHGLKARHLLSYRLAYAWLTSSKINQNGERERERKREKEWGGGNRANCHHCRIYKQRRKCRIAPIWFFLSWTFSYGKPLSGIDWSSQSVISRWILAEMQWRLFRLLLHIRFEAFQVFNQRWLADILLAVCSNPMDFPVDSLSKMGCARFHFQDEDSFEEK